MNLADRLNLKQKYWAIENTPANHSDIAMRLDVDVDIANESYGRSIEIESNLSHMDIFRLAHRSNPHIGIMGMMSKQAHRDLVDEANVLGVESELQHQIGNTMPLIWKQIADRIALEWGENMVAGYTILQVLKTEINQPPVSAHSHISEHPDSNALNTAYCRLFQPDGASHPLLSQYPIMCYNGISPDVHEGDILIVPIKNWVGTGFMLDAVRQSGTIVGPIIMSCAEEDSDFDVIPPDWWRFNPDNDSGMDEICSRVDEYVRMTTEQVDELVLLLDGDTAKATYGFQLNESVFVHPTKKDAFDHSIAMSILASEVDTGAVVIPIDETEFIPAWKDKRECKTIDTASPAFAHYHDELRCKACNGRVLVKMSFPNRQANAACPHCKADKAIQFPHLISVSTEQFKTVGIHE